MIVGTMAASSTTTLAMTYLPQWLYFQAATAPSTLRVSVLGEGVLLDLDAAGVLALSNLRAVNRAANGFLLPLANGLVKGVNVEIVFTNTVASPVSLYGYSEQEASVYIESLRSTVLASSGATFSDFAILALPTMAAADTLDIHYADGTIQRMHRDEIQSQNMVVQNNLLSYIIDNLDARIKSVTFVPTAQQVVYMMRYKFKDHVSPVL